MGFSIMGKRKDFHEDPDDERLSELSPDTASQSGYSSASNSRGHGFSGADARLEEGNDAYFRGLYVSDPDFRQLARRHSGFASVLKQNYQLDFSDPNAVLQLTKALLQLDFGLELELPDDRLCPPIPNRHNYILWLKELTDTSSASRTGRGLSGLDIGTGASCIYPLLGCTQRPWHFIGTDIDQKSLSFAKRNVALNKLQDRIKIVARKPDDALIPLDDLGVEAIDFVMTNPPFYESEMELVSLAAKKSRPPHSACTGASVEMVCPGGETQFVGCILAESLGLRDRVRWYTAMLGKASSVETIVEQLRGNGVDNYAVTEFVQGHKTRRWAIGWSFGPLRPSQAAARGLKGPLWRRLLPANVETDVLTSPPSDSIARLAEQIQDTCQSLELISWEWDAESLTGIGDANTNVWGRAWRRRQIQGAAAEVSEAEAVCRLGFKISLRVGAEVVVRVRWTEGHDSILFESFCAFLRTRLKTPKLDAAEKKLDI